MVSKCPECGFLFIVKDGCRICNPNSKEEEKHKEESTPVVVSGGDLVYPNQVGQLMLINL